MASMGWLPTCCETSGTLNKSAAHMKTMFPYHPKFQVSYETVNKTIYAQPRAGGVDRCRQAPNLVSIHLRPSKVEERLLCSLDFRTLVEQITTLTG